MIVFKRCGYEGCVSHCRSQENNCVDYKNVELCDEYIPNRQTMKELDKSIECSACSGSGLSQIGDGQDWERTVNCDSCNGTGVNK